MLVLDGCLIRIMTAKSLWIRISQMHSVRDSVVLCRHKTITTSPYPSMLFYAFTWVWNYFRFARCQVSVSTVKTVDPQFNLGIIHQAKARLSRYPGLSPALHH
jgi:hypothetical protein